MNSRNRKQLKIVHVYLIPMTQFNYLQNKHPAINKFHHNIHNYPLVILTYHIEMIKNQLEGDLTREKEDQI